MKKYIILFIIFIFPFFLFCQGDYEFSNLVLYGESENFDSTFENILGSDKFVKKFNLKKIEIGIIGYWTNNFYSKTKQNGKNVKILGLDFYPNRVMEMSTDCIISDKRVHKEFFFTWKIEQNDIYVKVLSYFTMEKDAVNDIIILKDCNYELLGKISFYKDNFILTNQLDFSFLNNYLAEKSIEFHKDDFRYRILSGRAIPSFYDKIGTNISLQNFLLNFNAEKESDFIKLKKNYYFWE